MKDRAHGTLSDFTERFARSADPLALLAGAAIDVRVHPDLLELPGRVVRGAWDPLLRRIELYGARGRSDAELLTSLAHEMWHAADNDHDEAAAEAFARAWVAGLAGGQIRRWGLLLRARTGRDGVR